MNYVKIGGRVYDVIVSEISESFEILYSENTGRTLSDSAKMILDPLGTFFGHKVTFLRKNGKEEEFDSLFNYLSVPRSSGIPVELVHGQKTISYNAYVSKGERKLTKINDKTGKVYWDALSVNIVPIEAQVTP